MRLTGCYIVKNEEDNIEHSLKSIQCADEIIVVDTGSTDKTKTIVQRFGAQVYDYPWHNDFSAPRNYALDKSTGDWVIFLDADEYFIHPERVRSYIETLNRDEEYEGVAVPLMNITGSDKEDEQTLVVRIWRNRPEYRYRGRIHEALYNVNEHGGMRPLNLKTASADLLVYHNGYREEKIQQKLERNLEMIYHDMEEYGEEPLTPRYLADCCFGLREYELAAYYAQKAVTKERELGITTLEGRSKLYIYWLQAGQKLAWPVSKLAAIAEQAVQDTGNEPNNMQLWTYIEQFSVQTGCLGLYHYMLTYQKKNHDLCEVVDCFLRDDKAFQTKASSAYISRINDYLAALLMMEDNRYAYIAEYSKWLAVLPDTLVRIVKAFYGEGSLELSDYDAYMVSLRALYRRGSNICYQRFAELGRQFFSHEYEQIAKSFRKAGKEMIWQES